MLARARELLFTKYGVHLLRVSYRFKVVNENTKKNLFAIITYGYPMLSARAVPMLQDFCKKFVTKLQ